MQNHYRLYGRHKSHPLKPRQARLVDKLLPELELKPDELVNGSPERLFAAGAKTIWLEIGFGGGEHLAWQAERNPDVGFIGCEPFVNGVAKLLSEIVAKSLGNIRILNGDVRPLLECLASTSISRVFLLYPDPWPKRRHHKRRFINQDTLGELHRILAPGGELRVASDIPDYVRWTLLQIRQFEKLNWSAEGPKDWRIRSDDWPTTRYEQKAVREGRIPTYLTFTSAT